MHNSPFRSVGDVLLIHPTGNQFVRHLLGKMLVENRLGFFATSLGFVGKRSENRFLPLALAAEIGRRSYDLPREKLWTRPWLECVRLSAGKLNFRSLVRHQTGWACIDAVLGDLDLTVAKRLPEWQKRLGLATVYGYEDGCAEVFSIAGKLGMLKAYDLPIAYWEKSRYLLQEEAKRWPEWEPTLGATRDNPAKTKRKNRELDQADIVVCPSSFVSDSLPDWVRRKKQIVIAPFGSPEYKHPNVFDEGGRARFRNGCKLRVLFAGTLSQRKGLADVFAAMQLIDRADIELVVMGSAVLPLEFYRAQYRNFIYEAPRPHVEVLRLMRTCDVLILPSIVEGRALVMQEAMSQGLPIIITPNTGGADLVEEGKTGFMVPIASPNVIADRLICLSRHPEMLPAMRIAAQAKAAAYTWSAYANKIIDVLRPSSRSVC